MQLNIGAIEVKEDTRNPGTPDEDMDDAAAETHAESDDDTAEVAIKYHGGPPTRSTHKITTQENLQLNSAKIDDDSGAITANHQRPHCHGHASSREALEARVVPVQSR